jgi:hypothetical protein
MPQSLAGRPPFEFEADSAPRNDRSCHHDPAALPHGPTGVLARPPLYWHCRRHQPITEEPTWETCANASPFLFVPERGWLQKVPAELKPGKPRRLS